MAQKKSGWNFNYTTRDIVIIAVIAAITGVVNTGVGNLWYLANTSLGPLGGAMLQGAFMWAYILAMWLVRKPGAALIVGIIEASTEILLGNAAGIGTLGWGITQGLAIEAVMAISFSPLWVGSINSQRCLVSYAYQSCFRGYPQWSPRLSAFQGNIPYRSDPLSRALTLFLLYVITPSTYRRNTFY